MAVGGELVMILQRGQGTTDKKQQLGIEQYKAKIESEKKVTHATHVWQKNLISIIKSGIAHTRTHAHWNFHN